MTATARKADPDLVAEAARRALDDAKGDAREATRMLVEAVRQSRRLRDALLDPLISNACYDAVRAQIHIDRRNAWRQPAEKLVPSRSGVTGSYRVVQLAAGTLLMFPLPGGKKLGDATREDITAAASFYETQSADMAHKSRWLRLVSQHIEDGKTVGDVMTDKRLRELQEEARRG